MDVKELLLLWFIIFVIKSRGSVVITGSVIKNEVTQNQQLAKELHKAIIRKFKKRKVSSSSYSHIFIFTFIYFHIHIHIYSYSY